MTTLSPPSPAPVAPLIEARPAVAEPRRDAVVTPLFPSGRRTEWHADYEERE